MKYTPEQVIAWTHRCLAGDSVNAIARENQVSARSIRRAFERHGLAKPSDYQHRIAIPPPIPGETPADPAGVVDQWAGMVEFVGPHLHRAIESLLEHGTIERAAEALSIKPAQLRARLSEAHHIAARRGWSPGADMNVKTAPGFHVKGTSTYYKVDPVTGEKRPSGQWVKTDRDKEHRVQLLLDAMRSVMAGFEGRAKPVKASKVDTKKWLAVYPMGDPHMGLFADGDFTGDDDTDLEKGRSVLFAATESLVDLAPACERALIIDLGDFFHSDTMANVTTRSKHPLDVSGMWGKILRVGIDTLIRCIEVALTKHKRVDVICEIGNHDDHSAVMLAIAVDIYFRNEPRVHVDMSQQAFHWYRFANNLIGVHHGHRTKMEQLPAIMATDQREQWGATEFHYWYTGHVHHLQTKEFPGCIVDSFRTMVPRDSYHAAAGYRSGRSMELDLIHEQFGRRGRHSIGIEMLRAQMLA